MDTELLLRASELGELIARLSWVMSCHPTRTQFGD